MSSLTFPKLCTAATEVLKSKSTSSVLYLDKTGMATSDSATKASIIEIFHRAKKFHAYSESDKDNWTRYVHTIIAIMGKEYHSAEAGLLFRRLIYGLDPKLMKAEALVSKIDKDQMHSLFTMFNTNQWISEQCMQELFVTLRHEFVHMLADLNLGITKIPASMQLYFTNIEGTEKQEALQPLIDAIPTSVFGEILYAKLKSQSHEPGLFFPVALRAGEDAPTYSVSKVSSFAERGFIDELIGLYPELSVGLEEIYTFCNLLKNFIHVFITYKKIEAAIKVVNSFEDHYLLAVHPLDREDARIPSSLILSYKQSHTKKLIEVMIVNKQANEELAKKPGYNDLIYDQDIDIKPFLEVTSDYLSSYQPFFYQMFDEVKKTHTEEKKKLLESKDNEMLSPKIKRLNAFDPRFDKIRASFLGPTLPEYVPSLSEWIKYIESVKAHVHKAFKNSTVIDSAHKAKAMRKVLEILEEDPSLKTVKKHVHKVAASAHGGGGATASGGCGAKASASVCAAACDDEIELDHVYGDASSDSSETSIAEQIESTRRLFSKPKTSKVADLYTEIGKQELAFTYAERVLNWFVAQEAVLEMEPYNSMSKLLQEKMVKIHAFSFKVDHFLNSRYSQKRIWHNSTKARDEDLYVIPGFMTFSGVTHKGVFEYCITDQCYHRCFKILRSTERFSDYLDAPDFDYAKAFPSLHETIAGAKSIVASCSGDFEVTIDPLGAAHFADGDVTYTLLNLT